MGAIAKPLPQSERPESVLVMARGVAAEAAENDILHPTRRV
jgi:hypothetical protein